MNELQGKKIKIYELEIEQEELLILSALLNEVCSGLHIPNFEEKIGCRKEYLMSIFCYAMYFYYQEYSAEDNKLYFDENQIFFLKNAFVECFKGFEDWIEEFQIRTGYEWEEARTLEDKIAKL